MDKGSFKELENVRIKATYNMELGGRTIEDDEVILYFDRIQIANLNEITDVVTANGGYGNRAHVFWETTKEVRFAFSQGIFSKDQFSLMANAKLFDVNNNVPIVLSRREHLESDENGFLVTKDVPIRPIFVYRTDTGEKITDFLVTGINKILIHEPYVDTIVDYDWQYTGGAQYIQIGRRLLNGFVSLVGETRVKDDTTGQIVTGIFTIPKLRLMSDLSIRLGAQANPVVASFNAVGVPVGSRDSSYVAEFMYLGEDINSDL